MGKPSKPYGLPDFGKWTAISKYVRYFSVRLTVQKLRRLTKIIHFKPPLHNVTHIEDYHVLRYQSSKPFLEYMNFHKKWPWSMTFQHLMVLNVTQIGISFRGWIGSIRVSISTTFFSQSSQNVSHLVSRIPHTLCLTKADDLGNLFTIYSHFWSYFLKKWDFSFSSMKKTLQKHWFWYFWNENEKMDWMDQ